MSEFLNRRRVFACAIVASLVCVPWGISVLRDIRDSAPVQLASMAFADQSSTQSAFGFLGSGCLCTPESEQLASFEEECFELGSFGAVRIAGDGSVCSFESDKDEAELFAVLQDQLERRGWVQLNTGQGVASALLMKNETGSHAWLLLSCARVADTFVYVCQLG